MARRARAVNPGIEGKFRLTAATMLLSYYETLIDMSTVTLSPKYQVVIPQPVRSALALRPGAKFQVVPLDGRIELVPVLPMAKARGFLRLKDIVIERDEEDRL